VSPTAVTAILCQECKQMSNPGNFCQNCGKPLNRKLTCKGCNEELQPGAKFCPNCGAKTV
jgi:rRNA maturation endonuclease Nob1